MQCASHGMTNPRHFMKSQIRRMVKLSVWQAVNSKQTSPLYDVSKQMAPWSLNHGYNHRCRQKVSNVIHTVCRKTKCENG